MATIQDTSADDGWETSSSTSASDSDTTGEQCPDTPAIKACAACNKPQSELTGLLKRCAKCQTQHYCSRDCQTADWPIHKKSCGKPTPITSDSNPSIHNISNAFSGSDNPLHQMSEKDAFIHLIDCYRMRVEDEYVTMGDGRGLYGEMDPLNDFRGFLNEAEKRNGLLPAWWSKAKRKACEKLAVKRGQWAYIGAPVEKSDVVEHYMDPLMPMKLRMLGEQIEGNGVGWGFGIGL